MTPESRGAETMTVPDGRPQDAPPPARTAHRPAPDDCQPDTAQRPAGAPGGAETEAGGGGFATMAPLGADSLTGLPSGTAGTPGTGPARGQSVIRRFICGDLETRSVLSEVRGQLACQGLDDDDLGTLELVLAEALNNVTEHAYGPEGGPVELSIAMSTSPAFPEPTVRPPAPRSGEAGEEGPLIHCELRDYGRPMPAGGPPQSGLPTIAPPDLLPEGGFGWHIIRCLVLDLSYERLGNCNRLRLTVQASAAN
jgi:serine/threonine-protein kinase RsbW